jgi:hypothetical protein
MDWAFSASHFAYNSAYALLQKSSHWFCVDSTLKEGSVTFAVA